MWPSGSYVSMMKIGGQPILPPLVLDGDRPFLQKLKEDAIRAEVKMTERARELAEKKASSSSPFPELDESCLSGIDTEQVMHFIRLALKDSSHIEEVQLLQKAIFDELSKHDDSSLRRADSMDTLHNIDDFSNTLGSSREVSPSKSFPSAFPSPPKWPSNELQPAKTSPRQEVARMAPYSAKEGQEITGICQPWADESRRMLQSFAGPSVIVTGQSCASEPRMVQPPTERSGQEVTETGQSLDGDSKIVQSPLRNPCEESLSTVQPWHINLDQEYSRMVQSCEGNFAGPCALPGPPQSEHQPQSPVTPPKLIRRNSYTLESPSPSVLLYLKSLHLDEDISEKTLSDDNTVKRNLNDLWSEALLTNTSSATPMNQSAMSWRSELDQLSNCDHLSLSSQISASLRSYVSPPRTASANRNGNTNPQAKESFSKSNCCENNNVPPDIHKAACKIQAGVRGYLTRRLLKTARIVELKNGLRDCLITALQMHTETSVSKAELDLHRQLTLQIESLCDEWHQIFFEYSPQERMRIIQIDRNKAKNPKPKPLVVKKSRSRASMESSLSSTSSHSVATRPKSLPLVKTLRSATASCRPGK